MADSRRLLNAHTLGRLGLDWGGGDMAQFGEEWRLRGSRFAEAYLVNGHAYGCVDVIRVVGYRPHLIISAVARNFHTNFAPSTVSRQALSQTWFPIPFDIASRGMCQSDSSPSTGNRRWRG
ncbi:hypothetical protein PG985_009970 [Apiospora marii]|uniref:uncharacterized protein n=1 Tax=Apiospora marii TaxID=335849 RepID=UPI003131B810